MISLVYVVLLEFSRQVTKRNGSLVAMCENKINCLQGDKHTVKETQGVMFTTLLRSADATANYYEFPQ